MTEDDIKELEEAQEAFRAAIQSADAMTIAETDEHYHDIIFTTEPATTAWFRS